MLLSPLLDEENAIRVRLSKECGISEKTNEHLTIDGTMLERFFDIFTRLALRPIAATVMW